MISDLHNLPELPPIFGPARQVAYVVNDLDASMQSWHEQHGVGPFLVTRNTAPLSNAYYRGNKAKEARVSIAFAYIGDMQLELIEPTNAVPGIYREARERGITGVHHYAVLVDDFADAYNWALDNGFDAVIDAGVDGLARMSYLEDTERELIVEMIEWNGLTRPFFDGIERLVHAADPAQLVHEFRLADITPRGAVALGLGKFLLKKITGRAQTTRRPAQAAQ